MRRKDREITDSNKIKEIIEGCHCCRLGFCDEGSAYIVPLNFGYEEKNGKYTFYFHSAASGRKIDLIQKTHSAAFEMDTGYRLNENAVACQCSATFQSVMGTGSVSFVEGMQEKKYALKKIMGHNTGREEWSFPENTLRAVCVFKLEAEELSCKMHL